MSAMGFVPPARALSIQGSVIAALIQREIKTRFGTSGAGWVWLLLEPLMLCLFYVLLWEFVRPRNSPIRGTDVAEFLLTGMVPWQFFRRTANQVMHAIQSNRSLLVYPQVTPLDMALARATLETLIMYVVAACFLALRWFWLGPFGIHDLLNILLACLTLSGLGLGVGLAIMAFEERVFGLLNISTYIFRLLYFTSGIFFPLSAVPAPYRPYVALDPLIQAVEWARISYFGYSEDLLNIPFLMAVLLVVLLIGFSCERATRDANKRVSTS